jgi:lipoprotein-anchoring transpeptidase ErfK/SrfK
MLGFQPRAHLRAAAALSLASLVASGLAACSSDAAGEPREPEAAESSATPTETPEPRVAVRTNVQSTNVRVDRTLEVAAAGGTLQRVTVQAPKLGKLDGKMAPGNTRWVATERLEPGTTYTVRTVSVTPKGTRQPDVQRFRTADLTLDEQTYASIAPLDGETVGAGMPVIVSFDVAVTDKKSIQKHLKVTSQPAQPGAWHWLSDHEVHWRPKDYWRPGTHVEVDVDVNSVPAGAGVFGQESRHIAFEIGDKVVHKVDVDAHRMRTFINGSLARTIPISAGKPGWETRSGTKVIIEKHRRKRMNAATIGVDENDPEYYDLSNVEYALRVTYSGEFLHAAPWSVGSQGNDNVSHGCVGMSTADARWVYDLTRRGDIVEVTGSDRWMTLENGYGDWNLPFADYKAGSAL